jgi:hypothetical protein
MRSERRSLGKPECSLIARAVSQLVSQNTSTVADRAGDCYQSKGTNRFVEAMPKSGPEGSRTPDPTRARDENQVSRTYTQVQEVPSTRKTRTR